MEPKKTRGRQKIVMKKMENGRHRLVTFSKRKSGLYKKACELSILCGAEVTIVTFSPAGNPSVFCTSSVETNIENLFRPSSSIDDNTTLRSARPDSKINELAKFYSTLLAQEEPQDEYLNDLKQRTERARQTEYWWDADLNKLSMPELEQTCSLFADLKMTVSHQLHKITDGASSSSLLTPTTANLFNNVQLDHSFSEQGSLLELVAWETRSVPMIFEEKFYKQSTDYPIHN